MNFRKCQYVAEKEASYQELRQRIYEYLIKKKTFEDSVAKRKSSP
jgi:hypothetical protein